jgi:hypothetical protein
MSGYEERPRPDEYAGFYAGYVARVPPGDIVSTLRDQIGQTRALLYALTEERAAYAYAPSKWTIKEVVGHLTDVERLLSYRALRFARGDQTPVPGFDENTYVPAGRFGDRPLASLLSELEAARGSTVAMFEGLPAAAWVRRGVANGQSGSVRALAWIIAGHELHHRTLLEERYLAVAGEEH